MDGSVEQAAEVRRMCSAALVKLATGQQGAALALLEAGQQDTAVALLKNGQQDAAVELLEALGSKCWGIVQGAAMAAEVADMHTEEFDLSGLRVDLTANGPEHDED